MKKVGIYNPYWQILGGAEKYLLNIAECLQNDCELNLFGIDEGTISKAQKKFAIKLNNYQLNPWLENKLQRYYELRNLDIFFYITDGSIFFTFAQKNILIIQSPAHIPGNNFINQFKLLSWQKLVCYSEFVANIIRKRLGRQAETLFVPIRKVSSSLVQKKNLILSVGRFFPHLHNKKQKEMAVMFGKMVKQGLKNTELLLVGSVDPGGEDYLSIVKKAIIGLPIRILVNITQKELQRLYTDAKVYWHASGYGEDLDKYPEKAEHFGVTTVEAQAHGAVPIVFAGGGQSEIVTDGYNGFVWRNYEELFSRTQKLLTNEALRLQLASNARISANQYTQEKFCDRLHEILKSK